MNTVIKIDKAGHSMSPQEGVDAIVMDIDDLTNRFRERSIDYACRVGNLLIDLKQESKAAGLKWGDVCERLPFNNSTACKFMRIVKNESLKNLSHATDLPSDYSILDALARLPAPELEQHIKAGRITPTMKRTDAARLVHGDEPDKASHAEVVEPAPDRPKSRGRGLEIAHEAIQMLHKIPYSDGLRDEAFNTVIDWIDANGAPKEPTNKRGRVAMNVLFNDFLKLWFKAPPSVREKIRTHVQEGRAA